MPQTSSQGSPQSSRSNGASTAVPQTSKTSKASTTSKTLVSTEAVARRAYEKYLARGRAHGSDKEDWAAAEQELIAEASGTS